MKTVLCKSLASLVLGSVTLFGLACNETKTPTEPVASFNPPRPTQTPTPVQTPGQPAVMSGTVTWLYGESSIAGAIVSCQGKSTTSSNDGAYNLTALTSGKTTVTVYWPSLDYQNFAVELKPGPNTADLRVGP